MGWKPTAITGCKLWLDASQITGLNDGDKVANWPDMSGNGYNATQSTSAQQPVYKANFVSGKPAISFDGADDVLIGTMQALGTSNATYFQIFRQRNMTGENVTLFVGTAGVPKGCSQPYHNAGKFGYSGWGDDYTSTVAIPVDTWCQETMTRDGANIKDYASGTINFTFAHSGNNNVAGTFSIGGVTNNTRYATAYIAETIIYNSLLSDSNRLKVEAYLNWKYFGGSDTGGFGSGQGAVIGGVM